MNSSVSFYQKHSTTVFLIAVVCLRFASSATAVIAILLLVVYCFRGLQQAVLSLVLLWLFIMLNGDIVPSIPQASILRYLVIFACAIAVFLRRSTMSRNTRLSYVELWTLALGTFFLLHSFLFSHVPLVSVLKTISWTLVMLTSVAAWKYMTPEIWRRTSSHIYHILVGIMIISLPLLTLPQSYMIHGSYLFRGIMSHSQPFGSVLALLAVWTLGRLLDEPGKSKVLILALALVLLPMTGSRTAVFAVALSTLVLISVGIFTGRSKMISRLSSFVKSPTIIFCLAACLVYAVVNYDNVIDSAFQFVQKSSRSTGVISAYEESRGHLISEMWQNFTNDPLFGLGFGIASDPDSMLITYFDGIPVSAIVEKGVLPVAVLEEVGLPGGLLVFAWILSVIFYALRASLAAFMIVWTVLFLNLGESTLFSPGGMGLLSLVLIGAVLGSPNNQLIKRARS